MNAFVIQKADGMFVAELRLNRGGSYTDDVLKARVFSTKQSAEAYGVCGNERVVNVMDLLTHSNRQENFR